MSRANARCRSFSCRYIRIKAFVSVVQIASKRIAHFLPEGICVVIIYENKAEYLLYALLPERSFRRLHKRFDKVCGFRNVLTIFFAMVALAIIIYFQMYAFWLI